MNRIRQERIKKHVESCKFATIKELHDLFPDVSLMTLHRDLNALEEMGVVTKYRGGVRSVRQADDLEFNIRMKENNVGKMSMVKKAMKLLKPKSSIFLDASTSNLMLARNLPDMELNITTISPNIAIELCRLKNSTVNLCGGTMNPRTLSVSGGNTMSILENINIDLAFIGVSGCSADAGFTCRSTDVNVIYNFDIALRNRRMVRDYVSTSAQFNHEAQRIGRMPNREIYLFVIGESSRAANWELYGYSRQTNPLLQKRNDVLLFKNVITQSNTTHKSVPLMLSSVDAHEYNTMFYRKGISDLFKSVGFYTCFISTQSPQGAMVDNFAMECDEIVYVEPSECDMQLLESVQRIVENTEREKLFLVLHCYGSHYCYNQRYTEEFAVFLPDDECAVNNCNRANLCNSYDNSILYTDYFLNEVIETLCRQMDACSAMLYCADHGEDLMDNGSKNFLHSSPKTTYFQTHVAALAWFSPVYSNYFSNKVKAARENAFAPATTHSVFHTVADMASLRSSYIKYDVSLVNDGFDYSTPRLYVDDHNNAVALDGNVGIDAMQRSLFRRAGVPMP
mgnify:CR=1 FL=1